MRRGTAIPERLQVRPRDDSDQLAHPRSLIRIFTGHSVGSQGSKAFSGGRRKLRSAYADAQADLSSLDAHAIVQGRLYPGSNGTTVTSIEEMRTTVIVLLF